jgi:hypothetical protein
MPLFQTSLFVAFTALWLYFSLYLVSSGTVHTHVDELSGISYKSVSYDSHAREAILFLVFVWLWR